MAGEIDKLYTERLRRIELAEAALEDAKAIGTFTPNFDLALAALRLAREATTRDWAGREGKNAPPVPGPAH